MFPCQTCDHLVSFCKKLITASADRISPKSSEILSSRKKNDFFFFFLKKSCGCILFSFLCCGTRRGRDGLEKKIVCVGKGVRRNDDS